MLNISITADNVVVENRETGGKWTNETVNFFGLVYSRLEANFPNFTQEEMARRIITHVVSGVKGEPKPTSPYMFHCREIGTSLYDLISYIDGRSVIAPTLKDIEDLRIAKGMTVNYLPIKIGGMDGMRFEGLKTVSEVMVAALYYYAYHEYKLVRCKHCGKWFATKTLKKEYCDRVSPCFGNIVGGKTPLSCEQAVRNILQKCGRMKNRIETKTQQTVTGQLHTNPFLEKFNSQCMPLYVTAKKFPTVNNLTSYYNFLKDTEKERGWIIPDRNWCSQKD